MAEIDVKAIRAVAEKAGTSEDIDLKYSAICIRHDVPALCDAYEAQAKEVERLICALQKIVTEYKTHDTVGIDVIYSIARNALSTKLAKELEHD